MNLIEINNPLQDMISDSFIEKVLQEGISQLRKERIISVDLQFELSVALVDKESIRRYNLEYRNADKPTDVLSFCYEKDDDKIIGEMLLCFDVIKEYAKEDKKGLKGELVKNLIHSLLHIVGFEHGDEMFEYQEMVLGKVKGIKIKNEI